MRLMKRAVSSRFFLEKSVSCGHDIGVWFACDIIIVTNSRQGIKYEKMVTIRGECIRIVLNTVY